MLKKRNFLIFLCLSIAWICVIFGHSLMPASVSSKESGGVLAWLIQYFPWLTHHLLRKIAHFAAFAVLGCFFTCTLWQTKYFYTFRPIIFALLVAFLDETVQIFVEGRSAQISDMWIDFGGAVFGTLIVRLILQIFIKKRTRINF